MIIGLAAGFMFGPTASAAPGNSKMDIKNSYLKNPASASLRPVRIGTSFSIVPLGTRQTLDAWCRHEPGAVFGYYVKAHIHNSKPGSKLKGTRISANLVVGFYDGRSEATPISTWSYMADQDFRTRNMMMIDRRFCKNHCLKAHFANVTYSHTQPFAQKYSLDTSMKYACY